MSLCGNQPVYAIEQTQLRRQHRVDGAGRPKFDFHTGVAPAVEDVAAVLAAAQSALGPAAHHRMRPSGPDGDALTSPLDLQAWLLDECPEPSTIEDLEAAPDPKFATW